MIIYIQIFWEELTSVWVSGGTRSWARASHTVVLVVVPTTAHDLFAPINIHLLAQLLVGCTRGGPASPLLTPQSSHLHCCLEASSKLPPTSSGTSSSSSSPALLSGMLPMFFMMSLRKEYCWGPTCLRISGIISLSSLVSGLPVTTSKFSRTENWTISQPHIRWRCFLN